MKQRVVSFDLDSTLADTRNRKHLFKGEDTDWVAYAQACHLDPPTSVVALAKLLHELGVPCVVVSSRPQAAALEATEWLKGVGVEVLRVILDPGSGSRSVPFKVAALRKLQEEFDVVLHVDDWYSIGEAVERELGIPTIIVNPYDPAEVTMSR